MYFRLLWILLLLPLSSMASWTGMAAYAGKNDSDWLQSTGIRQSNIDFYGLRIEEKTQADLRVGATAGQFDLRLFDPLDVTVAEKYSGQFVSLYLRWPIKLSENIKFHSRINYQFNLGEKSLDTENSEINWTDISLDLGVSLKVGLISLRPFIKLRSIDGDITSPTQTKIFKHDETFSQGLILDLFVERTAFVRLLATTGSDQLLLISFAREY